MTRIAINRYARLTCSAFTAYASASNLWGERFRRSILDLGHPFTYRFITLFHSTKQAADSEHVPHAAQRQMYTHILVQFGRIGRVGTECEYRSELISRRVSCIHSSIVFARSLPVSLLLDPSLSVHFFLSNASALLIAETIALSSQTRNTSKRL
jgi:hypothetical protein